jgi:cytochrome b
MANHSSTSKIKVWDGPVRLFHWTFVILVLFCWFSGEWRGERFPYHAYAGYAAGIVLLFRIIWGFAGSSYAKFTDFVYSPGKTVQYAMQVMSGKPPRYVGHNPLGGWMIILMMLVIGFTIVTGVIAPSWHDVEEIHEFMGENIIILLVAIHLLGVIVDSIMTRENLARAMVTGTKPAELYEGSPVDAKGGGAGRAIIVAVVALGLGLGTAAAIDFKNIVTTEKNHQIEGYKRYLARKAAEEAAKAKAAAEQQGQTAPAENAAPPSN